MAGSDGRREAVVLPTSPMNAVLSVSGMASWPSSYRAATTTARLTEEVRTWGGVTFSDA